ncbi:MAG: hypothetical protein EBR23_09270 [Planctomycetia bacterium]|nr:hypothetical protein [Planctomycetia bacterium]
MTQQPATPRADVSLEDYFGNGRSLREFAGGVAVVVYAERHGATAALRLGQTLHARFGPVAGQPVVHVIPVACLLEVPRMFHGLARNLLRRQSPDVVVWIDFHGTLQRVVGLRPNLANVAVIDPQGRLGGAHAGDFDQQLVEAVVADVDRCRRGAEITPCPHSSG